MDIAWAAGIFEGEGYVTIQSGTRFGSLGVSQKDPYILYRLQALFGGSVRPRTNGRWESLYNYLLCGSRARGLAMTLFSFLSPRRKEQLKRGGLTGPFRLYSE